jgi:hypothetical protein
LAATDVQNQPADQIGRDSQLGEEQGADDHGDPDECRIGVEVVRLSGADACQPAFLWIQSHPFVTLFKVQRFSPRSLWAASFYGPRLSIGRGRWFSG